MLRLVIPMFVLAVLAAPAWSGPRADPDRDQAKLGERAPDFTLRDLDDRPWRLADHGQHTVVLVWFSPDCPFVANAFRGGEIGRLLRGVREHEGTVVAINSTAVRGETYLCESSRAFLREHESSIRVLLDPDAAVARRYDARTTPHVFVVHRGILRYHGALSDDPWGRASNPVNHALVAVEQIAAGDEVARQHVKPWGCRVKYRE